MTDGVLVMRPEVVFAQQRFFYKFVCFVTVAPVIPSLLTLSGFLPSEQFQYSLISVGIGIAVAALAVVIMPRSTLHDETAVRLLSFDTPLPELFRLRHMSYTAGSTVGWPRPERSDIINHLSTDNRMILLVGPSGSGKSHFSRINLQPEGDETHQLSKCFLIRDYVDAIQSHPAGKSDRIPVNVFFPHPQAERSLNIVVIDQFEDIFALDEREGAQADELIKFFDEFAARNANFKVLFCVRSERYYDCRRHLRKLDLQVTEIDFDGITYDDDLISNDSLRRVANDLNQLCAFSFDKTVSVLRTLTVRRFGVDQLYPVDLRMCFLLGAYKGHMKTDPERVFRVMSSRENIAQEYLDACVGRNVDSKIPRGLLFALAKSQESRSLTSFDELCRISHYGPTSVALGLNDLMEVGLVRNSGDGYYLSHDYLGTIVQNYGGAKLTSIERDNISYFAENKELLTHTTTHSPTEESLWLSYTGVGRTFLVLSGVFIMATFLVWSSPLLDTARDALLWVSGMLLFAWVVDPAHAGFVLAGDVKQYVADFRMLFATSMLLWVFYIFQLHEEFFGRIQGISSELKVAWWITIGVSFLGPPLTFLAPHMWLVLASVGGLFTGWCYHLLRRASVGSVAATERFKWLAIHVIVASASQFLAGVAVLLIAHSASVNGSHELALVFWWMSLFFCGISIAWAVLSLVGLTGWPLQPANTKFSELLGLFHRTLSGRARVA